jgi:hypothetical protein
MKSGRRASGGEEGERTGARRVRNPIGKIGEGVACAVKKAWGREGVGAEKATEGVAWAGVDVAGDVNGL